MQGPILHSFSRRQTSCFCTQTNLKGKGALSACGWLKKKRNRPEKKKYLLLEIFDFSPTSVCQSICFPGLVEAGIDLRHVELALQHLHPPEGVEAVLGGGADTSECLPDVGRQVRPHADQATLRIVVENKPAARWKEGRTGLVIDGNKIPRL